MVPFNVYHERTWLQVKKDDLAESSVLSVHFSPGVCPHYTYIPDLFSEAPQLLQYPVN